MTNIIITCINITTCTCIINTYNVHVCTCTYMYIHISDILTTCITTKSGNLSFSYITGQLLHITN